MIECFEPFLVVFAGLERVDRVTTDPNVLVLVTLIRDRLSIFGIMCFQGWMV